VQQPHIPIYEGQEVRSMKSSTQFLDAGGPKREQTYLERGEIVGVQFGQLG
jgi:hypothetical protein